MYGVIGFIIGSIVVVGLYRALQPPGTPLMLVRLVEGYGVEKSWRPLDDISPHLIRAAMAGEDARFCRHHGFDWGAIATAWDHCQSGHGRRRAGADELALSFAGPQPAADAAYFARTVKRLIADGGLAIDVRCSPPDSG